MVRKKETIKEINDNVVLHLKVTPNAQDFEIKGVNPWTGRLEIRVTSRARKGKANKELIQKLEEHLEKRIRIQSGKRSRKKLVLIRNASKEEVEKQLGNKP